MTAIGVRDGACEAAEIAEDVENAEDAKTVEPAEAVETVENVRGTDVKPGRLGIGQLEAVENVGTLDDVGNAWMTGVKSEHGWDVEPGLGVERTWPEWGSLFSTLLGQAEDASCAFCSRR